ncbi:MAG: putative toxin-antitoxin system toxin component, PIN family [Tepidisphaeraceae bacterium]|jgi:putative PIN family toxin of toxin-antitoxin system
MTSGRRAVFDCNVFLQAMFSTHGAAHACWQSVLAGQVTVLVTPYILAEIRKLPEHKKFRKFSTFTADRVERFLEELLNAAELIADPTPMFNYPRDPDDGHYVDAAIASNSMLIVSNDRDLLDLMNNENADGKALRAQHPAFKVLTPAQFLAVIAHAPQT